MNILKVNKMVHKFQDLVEQKEVKTFTKFQNEIYLNFIIFDKNHKSYKFISYELKKIHAFLKEIQHHPNSHLLTQALKPMFEMLVSSLIIPKVVRVLDEKSGGIGLIKYADLILASKGKKLTKKTCDFFVIPYKGESEQVNGRLLKLGDLKPSWMSVFMTNKIIKNFEKNPNPLLQAELFELLHSLSGEEDENGLIDITNKKVTQVLEKLAEFYLKIDD